MADSEGMATTPHTKGHTMTNLNRQRYQELQWCKVARIARREYRVYFGRTDQVENSARAVTGLYR